MSAKVSETTPRVLASERSVEPASWAFRSHSMALAAKNIGQKIGRLYGINSPDFYDLSLFDNFLQELSDRKAIIISKDGVITASPLINDIVRHAEGVISTEIRQAILQEASPR